MILQYFFNFNIRKQKNEKVKKIRFKFLCQQINCTLLNRKL